MPGSTPPPTPEDFQTATQLGRWVLDWAAYLVALLSGLLYTQARAKAKEDKEAYTRELTGFKAALSKCISKEDFEKHEEREDKDRDERRAAEASIRDQVHDLDRKLDAKLTAITDHLLSNNH